MEIQNEGVANEATSEAGQANESTPEVSQDNLLKRVSEFQADNSSVEKTPEEIDTDFFSDPKFREKIEAIEDPELKAHLVAMRKSGISGINGKMQEIAEMRKDLQLLKQDKQDNGDFYDVERQIKDPKWVAKAQQINGNIESDEYVDPVVQSLRDEVNELKNQNAQTRTRQDQVYKQQEHDRLSGKYSNYNTDTIDTITLEMLEGKRASVNNSGSLYEDVYWARFGAENTKNAYELGRKDERDGRSTTPPSLQGVDTRASESINPEKDESAKSFLDRIIRKNIVAARSKTTV